MEAVELILYELRPKWCKIAEVIWKDCGGYMVTIAKMPFLGRTLCRGPTKRQYNIHILQYSNKALFFIFRAMRLRDAQSSSWSLLNLHSPGNVMATFCVVAMWLTLIVVI